MKKTLLNKSIRICPWRPPETTRGLDRHHRLADPRIIKRNHRKLVAPKPGAGNRLTFLSEANVVLIPRRKLAIFIDRCFHILEAADSEKVIVDIIGSGPSQLHRQA